MKATTIMYKNCPICQTSILPNENIMTCEGCKVKYHLECWKERGGCTTLGCKFNPYDIRTHNNPLLQRTYWGAETKTCPMCGETIRIGEPKCSYCGEEFDTTAPLTPEEVKERFVKPPEKIKENKGAIIIFICGLLGITAPFNLLFGGLWYKENKEKLKRLSPMHNLLAIVGLSISGFYSLVIFLAIIFSSQH
jgi:hypothetical protein